MLHEIIDMEREFTSTWEPTILKTELIAKGTWWYDNVKPFKVELIKIYLDYNSNDLIKLERILEIPFIDYIDYNVSDEGTLYYWTFADESDKSVSPTFSTFYQAREHIELYGTKFEIEWLN